MLTAEQERQIRDAAFRGAQLMDAQGPQDWPWKWPADADVDRLDMRHPLKCVLGQTYGSYGNGLRALDISNWGPAGPRYYGFMSFGFADRMNEWEVLGNAWRHEIWIRRHW